jgi:hypothetical protein
MSTESGPVVKSSSFFSPSSAGSLPLRQDDATRRERHEGGMWRRRAIDEERGKDEEHEQRVAQHMQKREEAPIAQMKGRTSGSQKQQRQSKKQRTNEQCTMIAQPTRAHLSFPTARSRDEPHVVVCLVLLRGLGVDRSSRNGLAAIACT